MSINESELCSVEEVANELGLHVRTIRAYLRNGRLKGVRIGKQYRIRRQDVDALIGRSSSALGAAVSRHRSVDVSAIVQVDAISPDSANRITNMLMAAAKTPREEEHPLRVDTSYDEQLARLKVFVSGSVDTTVGMLRVVNHLARPETA